AARSVRRAPDRLRVKKAPERAEAQGNETSRDQGALDAPILSQVTNRARRGSRKRPDPPDRLRRAVACLNTQSTALVAVRVTLVRRAGCADACRAECFACRGGE